MKKIFFTLALLSSLGVAISAQEVCTPVVFEIPAGGIETFNDVGSGENTIEQLCGFTPGIPLDTIGWAGLTADTVNPASWCSEVRVDIGGGALVVQFNTQGAVAPCDPATGQADLPLTDLAAAGITITPDAAGCVPLEFFDSFDDGAGADGLAAAGTFTFIQCVPVPTMGTWALICLGISFASFGLVAIKEEEFVLAEG